MAHIHNLEQLYRVIMARKVPFFAVFFVAVFVTYAFLYALDIYPEPIEEESEEAVNALVAEEMERIAETEKIERVAIAKTVVENPLPRKIIFDSLNNKEVKVLNPVSSDIATLDEALLSGVIRHPESADFSVEGNIFILGHSSYLPNVLNKNFQAFNGIQNMRWGDKIRLQSDDTEYIYRVDKVYEAKASEFLVPPTPGESKLTLATCDVLGAKEDRFIVEATLVGSQAL